MFRKYPHPLFNRQTVVTHKEKDNKAQPEKVAKAEATPPDFQAEGIYPPARLAQAYVLWQKYGAIFSPAEALEKGTLFPELYSPY